MKNIVLGLILYLSAGASVAEQAPPVELTPPLPKEAYASCAALDGALFVDGVPPEVGLTLHSRPRMNAIVTAVLPSSATGVVKGKCKRRLHNLWCQVTWGCLRGYARTVFLREGDRPHPLQWAEVTGVPVDRFLMLYSKADERATPAAAISPTARVSVLDCVAGAGGQEWCAVVWGDKTGWTRKQYLQF
ncbi:hypothetical protein FEE96_10265 [Parasedimentitalea maritima]|uniref:SH3 domain-containing protein n=1 Tax=Parasedimentitalea maritima TaxID=2578117 RepID=A0ABY2UW69_9RHOB|nr:hypothetical protein [Zongyanglinia marina]TLP65870.1 hypothetical protein FEE96_10265 [Zongyanglinia marina]